MSPVADGLHTTAQLASLGVAWFVSAMVASLSLLGFTHGGEGRALNRIYSALAIVAAWYCFWVGFVHSGALPSPRLLAMSQLLTGLLGPLLFLFSWASTEERFTPPKTAFLVLLAGVPGTTLALVMLFFTDDATAQQVWAHYEATQQFATPLRATLFKVHTASMATFFLGALLLLVVRALRPHHPRARAAALFGLLPIAMCVTGMFATNLIPLWLPSLKTARLGPLAALPASLVLALTFQRSRQTLAALETQKNQLAPYLPREIVARIVDGTHSLALGGEQATGTILFSDIRGFTTMSAALSATDVVRFLNRYLDRMNEIIFRHGGMIDKFIGDAILAVFGIPDQKPGDADRALACARDMVAALDEINAWWVAQGHAPVKIGIGIHRGTVVHGNIGSSSRMEYTVIGDTVNAASRVEGLTKDHGRAIVVTDAVVDALAVGAGDVEFLGEQVLRGRSTPTKLYGLCPWQKRDADDFDGVAVTDHGVARAALTSGEH